jgi:hypothetical protein
VHDELKIFAFESARDEKTIFLKMERAFVRRKNVRTYANSYQQVIPHSDAGSFWD